MDNFLMNCLIPYNPFLADLLSSCFKLWFNQAYHLAVIL